MFVWYLYSRPVFAGEHGLSDGQLMSDGGATDVLGDSSCYVQLIWIAQRKHLQVKSK